MNAEITIAVIKEIAQLSQRSRCRVDYSFGPDWKTATGKQYFADIIDISSTTVT